MYKSLKYQDADGKMICATRDNGTMVIIEPQNGELWTLASTGALGPVADYVAPPVPSAAELLAAERVAMKCSTAQMGLALIDAEHISAAELAFADDPAALMIWQKATHVARRGPVLEALQTFLTEAEIDDLYRAAMAVEI